MRFIETPIFTRTVVEVLDDEQYRTMQLALVLRPQLGPVIRGSGGLRKLRWSLAGMGKRGGIRLISYWDEPSESFCMLYAYPKRAQKDLTARQLRTLARVVREEFE